MSESYKRLMEILDIEKNGPKKSLGQNFLISDTIIDRIIQKAWSFKTHKMIEIGPGPGSLTFFLKQQNIDLTLIELDKNWAEHWRQQGMQVIEEDALRLDWSKLSGPDTLLVSNLPYQISSSIVIDRCLDENLLMGMVLMFQKEVAQKIRGIPDSDHFGFLSVIAQSFWTIETVTDAGPKDFWPAPKVASRVLCFTPRSQDLRPYKPKAYLKFVKQAFHQRRKTLRSNWESYLNQIKPDGWKSSLDLILTWGFTEKLRAEELSSEQFQKIWKALQ